MMALLFRNVCSAHPYLKCSKIQKRLENLLSEFSFQGLANHIHGGDFILVSLT